MSYWDPDHAFHQITDYFPVDNVQDYLNIDKNDLNNMTLMKSSCNDPILISHFMKKWVLSIKGFWQCWGDNTMMDWTSLTVQNFEEYLVTDSGPNL